MSSAPMDEDEPTAENVLIAGENGVPAAAASVDDLTWAVVKMRVGARIHRQ